MSAETQKKNNEIEILWSAILAVSGALLRRSFLVTGTQAPNYTYILSWMHGSPMRMCVVDEGHARARRRKRESVHNKNSWKFNKPRLNGWDNVPCALPFPVWNKSFALDIRYMVLTESDGGSSPATVLAFRLCHPNEKYVIIFVIYMVVRH